MKLNTNQDDLINRKNWNKEEWLSFFQTRLNDMKSKRAEYDKKWDTIDRSSTAVSFYDNRWELQVNIPLEKTLLEIYEGRTRWKINFDIQPDWQADVEELQPAKYALMFFLDGNLRSNFWEENKKMKSLKGNYWNWIFFTWIRNSLDYRFKQKEDIEPNTDLLNKNNFEEYKHEEWYLFPKSIHNRDFWIDDNAYWQPSCQNALDCIMKESMKMVDLELRFKDKKNIDQKELAEVWYWIDANWNNNWITKDDIIIYHYYNRVTKTYMIVANEQHVLYNWYYFYDDWKLPFVNIQHYYDPNKFRTDWLSWRVSYLKACKSEVFQNILTWSAMASWINLVVWNDDELWQDWNVWGRQLNLWRTTWGAEWVQQVNSNINLWFFTQVMDLIDRETTIVTGINPSEQIDQWTEILWIAELNEMNKAVRTWSVDESYDIWLDEALTMTLDRIKQFAPSLLTETIKDSNWKVLKIIFPKITIKDMKVVKRNWKDVFEEDLWKYWYFELKKDTILWIGVKVTTPSTNSVLPIVERKKIDSYIENLNKLWMVAQLDQTWESMNKLKEYMRLEQVMDWMNDAYWYDADWLKANTNKDKMRMKNKKMLDSLKEISLLSQQQNAEQLNQETMWQEAVWMNQSNDPIQSPENAWSQIP